VNVCPCPQSRFSAIDLLHRDVIFSATAAAARRAPCALSRPPSRMNSLLRSEKDMSLHLYCGQIDGQTDRPEGYDVWLVDVLTGTPPGSTCCLGSSIRSGNAWLRGGI